MLWRGNLSQTLNVRTRLKVWMFRILLLLILLRFTWQTILLRFNRYSIDTWFELLLWLNIVITNSRAWNRGNVRVILNLYVHFERWFFHSHSHTTSFKGHLPISIPVKNRWSRLLSSYVGRLAHYISLIITF